MFKTLNRILKYLHGEGSWELRSYEREIVVLSSAMLDVRTNQALQKQLDSHMFVERFHNDRLVTIHLDYISQIERMSLPEDYNLAKLKLKSSNGVVWVSVGASGGLLASIQFHKPPKPILTIPFDVVTTRYGGTLDTTALEEIDKDEHGDS